MAECEIPDRRDELISAFKETVRRWFDPLCHPHVRWRDVEDARFDVVQHVHQLVRAKQLDPKEIEEQQQQPVWDGATPPIPS